MMDRLRAGFAFAGLGCVTLALMACQAPGKPGPGPEVPRPSHVLDFATLYQQNCAACHGVDGHRGIAVSLANPVYLALAGKDVLINYTAKGGPGNLMPPFARSYGGTLTDQQIDVLVDGMISRWGHPGILAGSTPPPYAAAGKGDPAAGHTDFEQYCARCHGGDAAHAAAPASNKTVQAGPVTNPDYLALISDQSLRSTIIAGMPDEGMPDWRGFGPKPLTDHEVTDIVTWLATLRQTTPGQTNAK